MATPATPQTNQLVPYVPQGSPSINGITTIYLKREFTAIQNSIASLRQVMVELEARLAAGGL